MEDKEKKMEEVQGEINTGTLSEEEAQKKRLEAAIAHHQQVVDDFKEGILHLRDYSGVRKFKSIRRAIRRGHVSIYGDIYPHRPFKNIPAKKGSITYKKKKLYEQFTHKTKDVS